MNLRTYLMIKRASEEAKADAAAAAVAEKAGLPAVIEGEGVESVSGSPAGDGSNLATTPLTFGDRVARVGFGAKAHPYYTALGTAGGALLGGGLGYGTAELAGLSGDDLSAAGRFGRYALIGGGALTGGALGGLGTAYALGGNPVKFKGDKKPAAEAPAAKTAGYYPYYRY